MICSLRKNQSVLWTDVKTFSSPSLPFLWAWWETRFFPNPTLLLTVNRPYALTQCSLHFVCQFVVLLFWTIFAYDRELVYPATIDTFFPPWINHAMVRTVTLSTFLCEKSESIWMPLKKTITLLMCNAYTVFSAHVCPSCVTRRSPAAAPLLPKDQTCSGSIRRRGLVLLILVSAESAYTCQNISKPNKKAFLETHKYHSTPNCLNLLHLELAESLQHLNVPKSTAGKCVFILSPV